MPGRYFPEYEKDSLGGYTAELDQQAGPNVYTVSVDHTVTASQQYSLCFGVPAPVFELPTSGQTTTNYRAKASLALSPQVNLSLQDTIFQYTNHVTPDLGVTYVNASQTANIPRMAFTFQPNQSTSIRFAAGASVAPPYLQLVSSSQSTITEGTFYQESANSAFIKPETAFGYDLGADKRLPNGIVLSSDLYLTNLKNMFFNSVTPNGTLNGSLGVLPLFVLSTQNIADARMDGVEFSAKYQPDRGFGFLAQGILMRDYVYDLPPNFYNGAGGAPLVANLAVIPNINFQGDSAGDTAGAGTGRVPYAQGYADVEYRVPNKVLALLGVQYYGSSSRTTCRRSGRSTPASDTRSRKT